MSLRDRPPRCSLRRTGLHWLGATLLSASCQDLPEAPARIRWMLHGGGPEDDAIFQTFIDAADRGAVVTLGANEDPEDPDLDWWDRYFIGLGASAADTVNTFRPEDGDAAEHIAAIDAADAIFVRGGDQTRYVEHWFGRGIGAALVAAFERGAVLGGSSAGCALLGDPLYDARNGSAYAEDVLNDSRDPSISLTDNPGFGLEGFITDSHFTERGRLPRLAVFVGHAAEHIPAPAGIGVDPRTSLFVRDDRTAFVIGEGAVTLLRSDGAVALTAGEAPRMSSVPFGQYPAGYTLDLGADDPVRERPEYVRSVEAEVFAPFVENTLDGSDPEAAQWGAYRLTPGDDPWAYVDHTIQLEPAENLVPGTLVVPRAWADPDLAEVQLGGSLWALAQHPGLLAVLLADGVSAHVVPPRAVASAAIGAPVLLDGSSIHHAGAPTEGWQTAAVEGARLILPGTSETTP